MSVLVQLHAVSHRRLRLHHPEQRVDHPHAVGVHPAEPVGLLGVFLGVFSPWYIPSADIAAVIAHAGAAAHAVAGADAVRAYEAVWAECLGDSCVVIPVPAHVGHTARPPDHLPGRKGLSSLSSDLSSVYGDIRAVNGAPTRDLASPLGCMD